MELHEAFRRIFRVHWKLILLCLAIGLGIAFAVQPTPVRMYAASARVVLDTPDPTSQAAASAIGDTARAIVTSRSRVQEALGAAEVRRNVDTVRNSRVTVEPVGTSGVIQLTVTDPDPQVAADVANSLATNLVNTRMRASRGPIDAALREVDDRLDKLQRRLDVLDQRITRAGVSELAIALSGVRDILVRQQLTLEQQRASLIATEADRPTASVIDPAVPPTEPIPGHRAAILALGALLGLTLGIGAAVFVEAYRPTVVGRRSLARELEAPLLNELPRPPDRTRFLDLAPLASSIRLAANAAGVGTVRLVAMDRHVDLSILRDGLRASLRNSNNGHAPIRVGTLVGLPSGGFVSTEPRAISPHTLAPDGEDAAPEDGAGTNGVVLVVPNKLIREQLVSVRDLFAITGWPLLGIVTYRRRSGWMDGVDRARAPRTKVPA